MSCKKCKCKVCSCIVNEQVKISVNKVVQNPNEKGIVDIKVPTKTSDLINDSGFGQGGNGSGKIDEIRVNGVPAPVQGKVAIIAVPTKTSDLTNDSNFVSKSYVDSHVINKNNPHNVTKEQLNLGNIDNTSDLNKPISTATQNALDSKISTTDVKSDVIYQDLKPVNSVAIEKHSVKKINTIADLRNTAGEYEGQIVELLGYETIGDKLHVNYVWDSNTGTDNGGSIINTSSGSWRKVGLTFNVKDFGAKGDGVTDDSEAIDKCIKAIRTTYNAWGKASVFFPKGTYLITRTINLTSPIGLTLFGESMYGTVLIFNNPDVPMFKTQTYIGLEFSRMRVIDTSMVGGISDVSLKTNKFLEFSGTGGGRNLIVNKVVVEGFHTQFKDISTINCDTCYFNEATFKGYYYFFDSENNQSVLNNFNNISCGGGHPLGAVFFIAGLTNTILSNINIVTPSPMFRFKNLANKYSQSRILVINAKLEWTSAHAVVNEIPKLIDADGQYAKAMVSFIGGGLHNVSTWNKDSRLIRLTNGANGNITFENGAWEGIIATSRFGSSPMTSNSKIKFTNCTVTNVHRNINIATSSDSGKRGMPIIYENCRHATNDEGRVESNINIEINKVYGAIVESKSYQSIVYPNGYSSTSIVNPSVIYTSQFDSFGQRIIITSIDVISKNEHYNQKIEISTTSDFTNIIIDKTISESEKSKPIIKLLSDEITMSDRLYFRFSGGTGYKEYYLRLNYFSI